MRLKDFLEVYDGSEPFWVNYSDAAGNYDAEYFNNKIEFSNAIFNSFRTGEELPYSKYDEIEYITHDGEGVLTIELKWE